MSRRLTLSILGLILSAGMIQPVPGAGSDAPAVPSVSVEGNRLVDGRGRTLQLRGVNRAGTEYACVQGWGIFEGEVDSEAIESMVRWGINAVRLPLNEDCWLGSPRLEPRFSGPAYRLAIMRYADRLARSGLLVILDLHWSSAGKAPATEQEPMADAERAPQFWGSVAGAFRHRPWVLFDLFNEPHDVTWDCWRDGCGEYAGMQDLVDAVRRTGATQPIILTGLDWGGDLRGWLAHRPRDPAEALVAGAHLYESQRCVDPACWDREVAPVAARVPVVVTEFGDRDCSGDFSEALMTWADRVGVSYLAWTWNAWDCAGGPALIRSYDGAPTAYGEAVRRHLEGSGPQPDRGTLIRLGVAHRPE